MNSREILIDWLQFTIKNETPQVVITKILKLEIDYFAEVPRGSLGYKKQLTYNNINILYDGHEDMGVHVVISGQGCRHYETFYPLMNLIYTINRYKGVCTRIDLALDDRAGDLIPLDKIIEDTHEGNLVSKWRTNMEYTKRDMNANILGRTISFGNRVSNAFLRIYDKALEQGLDETWIRLEIEFKKANAEELQKIITVNNSGELICGILKNYIRFLVPSDKDVNKSRWNTRRYWANLINGAEKVKLIQKAEEKTLEEKKQWLSEQAGPTMAMISLADGSIDFIYDLIKESAANLKGKHLVMLDNFEKLEQKKREEIKQRAKLAEAEKLNLKLKSEQSKGEKGNGK